MLSLYLSLLAPLLALFFWPLLALRFWPPAGPVSDFLVLLWASSDFGAR
jgi:hypothetical protein